MTNEEDPKAPPLPESDDPTPAGDTPQHAEEDAERGGTGQPANDDREPARDPEAPPAGRYKRDQIGGEGEGTTTIDVTP